jgi:hypothetical protein
MSVHSFLTSALGFGKWSTSRPGRVSAAEEAHYTLKSRRGGGHSRSGHSGKGKKESLAEETSIMKTVTNFQVS